MNPDLPIGIFDSGVGGLTVLKSLKEALPGERFIYLGDTARNPYGPKSAATIVSYSRDCARFLEKREVKLIVVACNTASSNAVGVLRDECSCPVIGMIDPVAEYAVKLSKRNCIGVIGTHATVSSRSYVSAIHLHNSACQVLSRACPLFVPLVEEGIFEGPLVELAIDRYLSSMRGSGIDTLILGCTHYPLLKSALSMYLGDKIEIVSCGEAVTQVVKNLLRDSALLKQAPGEDLEDHFYVTDTSEQFERLAAPFLRNGSIHAIQVHSL